MAIALYGSASTPTDNSTNTANPTVITPPADMTEGQLVYIVACGANTSGTLAMSETGGQTWTALTQRNTSRNRANCFWCRFNGTWSANPSVTMTGTANNIARMVVFSGDYGTATDWYVDVAQASATYSAPATPYTVTIPTITVAHTGTLGVLTWTSADDNTWGSLTETWTALSPAQVRNTSGSYDQSVTNAYKVFSATGASGTISQNQVANAGDAGTRYSIVFAQSQRLTAAASAAAVSAATAKPGKYVLASGSAASVSSAAASVLKYVGATATVVATSVATAVAVLAGKVVGFFNWLVKTPAVGGVAGPKLPQGCRVLEVSSYVTSGTSATFNVEERTSPESAGTDILSADQAGDADGASATSFANDGLAKDSWLYLDISAVADAPAILSVTVAYTAVAEAIQSAVAAVVESSVVTAVASVIRGVAASAAATGAALARATCSLVLSASVVAASSATAGASGMTLHSAAGSASAVSAATATATNADKVYGFYNWLVKSPATGGIAGPKVPYDITIVEVSSYVTAATSATFNVEERTSPESAGTDLLSSDQVADADGTTTATINNAAIAKDSWLWLDISATSGTPGTLSVTVAYYFRITSAVAGSASAVSSATANATILGAPRGSAVGVSSATARASRLRLASGSASATSAASAAVESLTGERKEFINWLISSPAVATVAGPKIPEDCVITEVSGYVIGGTGATINLQERVSPDTATPFLLPSDLALDADGALTTTLSDNTVAASHYLFLTIRSLTGPPTIISVTVFYTPSPFAKATARAVSSATATASVSHVDTVLVSGSATGRFGTTGDFVRARLVSASASADGGASASGAVTIILLAEASSQGASAALATAGVTRGDVSGTSTGVSAASATASMTRTVSASSQGSSSASASVTVSANAAWFVVMRSSATAFADYKDKVSGSATATSSATATATVNYAFSARASATGVSSATARASAYYWLAKATAHATSSATATVGKFAHTFLWTKVAGEWRAVEGAFSIEDESDVDGGTW